MLLLFLISYHYGFISIIELHPGIILLIHFISTSYIIKEGIVPFYYCFRTSNRYVLFIDDRVVFISIFVAISPHPPPVFTLFTTLL